MFVACVMTACAAQEHVRPAWKAPLSEGRPYVHAYPRISVMGNDVIVNSFIPKGLPYAAQCLMVYHQESESIAAASCGGLETRRWELKPLPSGHYTVTLDVTAWFRDQTRLAEAEFCIVGPDVGC